MARTSWASANCITPSTCPPVGTTGITCVTATGLITKISLGTSLNSVFSGTLPTQIGQLTALATFTLTNAQLTGTLPTELGVLSALTSFTIVSSASTLLGTIPSEMQNLVQLRNVVLDANPGIVGVLPAGVMSVPDRKSVV